MSLALNLKIRSSDSPLNVVRAVIPLHNRGNGIILPDRLQTQWGTKHSDHYLLFSYPDSSQVIFSMVSSDFQISSNYDLIFFLLATHLSFIISAGCYSADALIIGALREIHAGIADEMENRATVKSTVA